MHLTEVITIENLGYKVQRAACAHASQCKESRFGRRSDEVAHADLSHQRNVVRHTCGDMRKTSPTAARSAQCAARMFIHFLLGCLFHLVGLVTWRIQACMPLA